MNMTVILNLIHFTCSMTDIVKVVRKLKTNSSPGPDGGSVYFIKNVLAQISGSLSKVYRTSHAEGYVADDWKAMYQMTGKIEKLESCILL